MAKATAGSAPVTQRSPWVEPALFALNGLAATAVHFAVLVLGIEVLGLGSAALANVPAAACGILASFLGNRYVVFLAGDRPVAGQAARFVLLYAALAALHTGLVFLLSDAMGMDYRIAFVAATAVQVVLSYLGNRLVVFR